MIRPVLQVAKVAALGAVAVQTAKFAARATDKAIPLLERGVDKARDAGKAAIDRVTR